VEVVDQRGQVVDERVAARAVRPVGRGDEAAVGEGDAAVALLEVRHLLPPRRVVAARAVGEDERRSLAVHLVVELGPIALQERHGCLVARAVGGRERRLDGPVATRTASSCSGALCANASSATRMRATAPLSGVSPDARLRAWLDSENASPGGLSP